MTDWCLAERLQEVMFGSADNIVWRLRVPILVILNVPEELDLTESELLKFLERADILGPDHYLYHAIAREGLGGERPKFLLIKLGGGMPDEEMKMHLTQGNADELQVFDWPGDNQLQKYNSPYAADWYDPKVRNEYEFYKRYDIQPHQGWEYLDHHLTTEEARKR